MSKIPINDTVSIDLPTLIDTRLLVRFWAKVKKGAADDCWLWQAATNGKGYGIFRSGEGRDKYGSTKWILAHRFSYLLANGSITKGSEVDHLCRTRLCINPSHLEAVSHKENTLRGTSPSAMQARRDRCIKGHPFDKVEKRTGKRRCSICDREKELRRYIRRYGRVPKSRQIRTVA